MRTFEDFLLLATTTSLAAVATAFGAIWLLRKWLEARVTASVRHDFDVRLAELQSKLQLERDKEAAERQREVEAFQHQLDRHGELLTSATQSVVGIQAASLERRIVALETLWKAVRIQRAGYSVAFGVADVLRASELRTVGLKKPHVWNDLRLENASEIANAIKALEIESTRIYVDEAIYALCIAYIGVIGRISMQLLQLSSNPSSVIWHADKATRDLLAALLSPAEFKKLDEIEFGKISHLQRCIESRIIGELKKVLTGDDSGEAAIRQGAALMKILEESLMDDKDVSLERSRSQWARVFPGRAA